MVARRRILHPCVIRLSSNRPKPCIHKCASRSVAVFAQLSSFGGAIAPPTDTYGGKSPNLSKNRKNLSAVPGCGGGWCGAIGGVEERVWEECFIFDPISVHPEKEPCFGMSNKHLHSIPRFCAGRRTVLRRSYQPQSQLPPPA